MTPLLELIKRELKFLWNKSWYKYTEQMKSHESHGANSKKKRVFLKAVLWCWSVSVCAWERQREREYSSLLKLIYSINHSIWSLFIFTSRTVSSASHWALYVLPRRSPTNSKRAEHAFSCNLESKRVPALLGYFTVPKLYGQVPSDLPLIGVQACRYTSFTHSLIYVDAASSA